MSAIAPSIISADWRRLEERCTLDKNGLQWSAGVDAPPGVTPQAPSPHDLLDSALAACTALTLEIYAQRRGYALQSVHVEVSHEEGPGAYALTRRIRLDGALDDAQRADLLRVAEKCPIHKVLSGDIAIQTSLQ